MKTRILLLIPIMLLALSCSTAPPTNSEAFKIGLSSMFADAAPDYTYKIAVLPLVDFRTDKTDALGRYLANDVIFEISNNFPGQYKILERQLIDALLSEFEFSTTSGMISEDEIAEFGRMSGADYLVVGTKLELANIIQVNLRLVEVESAEIIGVAQFDLVINSKYATLINESKAITTTDTSDTERGVVDSGILEEKPDDTPEIVASGDLGDPHVKQMKLNTIYTDSFVDRHDWDLYAIQIRTGQSYEILVDDEWSEYPGSADVVLIAFSSDEVKPGISLSNPLEVLSKPIVEGINRQNRMENPIAVRPESGDYLVIYLESDNPGNTEYQITVRVR